MQIVVDGYNLLLRNRKKSTYTEAALERMREELIQKAVTFAAGKNIRIILVFDGQSGIPLESESRTGKIKVLFSRPPENADTVIKSIIQRHRQPREILVVTSDQPLARFARSCRCQLLSSEAWWGKLTEAQADAQDERYGHGRDLDLAAWLKIFGEKK